jgi:hypothetical protein
MTSLAQESIRIAAVGVGATAAMDLGLLGLKRAGIAGLDFALLGRWVGHLARGTWAHDAISAARPVPGEQALGWLAHYAVGVAFAALFVAVAGLDAMREPSLAAAASFGVATVIAPLFVMQPAMGAGFAASRTRTPLRNCLRSVANHAVFGAGLYVAAAAVGRVVPA